MHWTKERAEAILAHRAVKPNGDWVEFREHRVTQERDRLYGLGTATALAEAA